VRLHAGIGAVPAPRWPRASTAAALAAALAAASSAAVAGWCTLQAAEVGACCALSNRLGCDAYPTSRGKPRPILALAIEWRASMVGRPACCCCRHLVWSEVGDDGPGAATAAVEANSWSRASFVARLSMLSACAAPNAGIGGVTQRRKCSRPEEGDSRLLGHPLEASSEAWRLGGRFAGGGDQRSSCRRKASLRAVSGPSR